MSNGHNNPIVIDDALAMLLIATIKTVVTETLFWAKDKTSEEQKARAAEEETRTDDLIARMKRG